MKTFLKCCGVQFFGIQ